MLLVWRGSETSGEERQKFCATFHGFLQWCQSALQYFQCHTSNLFLFRKIINNGSKHLVVVAVVSFHKMLYASSSPGAPPLAPLLAQIKIKYFVLFQFSFSYFAT